MYSFAECLVKDSRQKTTVSTRKRRKSHDTRAEASNANPDTSVPVPSLNERQLSEVVSAVVNELTNRGLIDQPSSAGVPDDTQPEQEVQHEAEVSSQMDSTVRGALGLAQERSISQTVQPLSASCMPILEQSPPGIPPIQSMNSYSVMPSALVEDKLKQAIWNNEYIEFSDLLFPKNVGNADLLFHFNSQGNNVSVSTPTKSKKQLTIGQWLSAFHIFLDI